MTAYSDLKLRARAQAHDITDPSATVTGKDVNERRVGRRVYNLHISADADATTARPSIVHLGFPASEFPNGVEVKSITFRAGAITCHDDNHFTDTFESCGTDGVADSTVATLTSDGNAAGSKLVAAGSASVANKPYSAAVSGTVANNQIVAGGSLSLSRAKAGAGVIVLGNSYEVVVEAL